VLQIENVACARGDRLLFSGLSFGLAKGELVHLTGGNGLGKSSLLRLLAGFSRPLEGRISWKNESIEKDLALYRQQVIFLRDQATVKGQLDCTEHASFWGKLLGHSDVDAAEKAARFGLETVLDIPGRFLSSGQRRRTSLMLLDSNRSLWLLDEPFVGLDQAGVSMLLARIEDHRAQGGMVILTSHIKLALEAAQVNKWKQHESGFLCYFAIGNSTCYQAGGRLSADLWVFSPDSNTVPSGCGCRA
jgi:heme exporter protein A